MFSNEEVPVLNLTASDENEKRNVLASGTFSSLSMILLTSATKFCTHEALKCIFTCFDS